MGCVCLAQRSLEHGEDDVTNRTVVGRGTRIECDRVHASVSKSNSISDADKCRMAVANAVRRFPVEIAGLVADYLALRPVRWVVPNTVRNAVSVSDDGVSVRFHTRPGPNCHLWWYNVFGQDDIMTCSWCWTVTVSPPRNVWIGVAHKTRNTDSHRTDKKLYVPDISRLTSICGGHVDRESVSLTVVVDTEQRVVSFAEHNEAKARLITVDSIRFNTDDDLSEWLPYASVPVGQIPVSLSVRADPRGIDQRVDQSGVEQLGVDQIIT